MIPHDVTLRIQYEAREETALATMARVANLLHDLRAIHGVTAECTITVEPQLPLDQGLDEALADAARNGIRMEIARD